MEQRTCKQCGKTKNITAFPARKAPNGVPYRKHVCSSCKSAKYRLTRHGKETSKRIAAKSKTKYQEKKPETKQKLLDHVGQHSCQICGAKESLCFHHRNPTKKSFDIKWGLTHSYSLTSLKKEASKCDILCANCHTIHHYVGERWHAKRARRIKLAILEAIHKPCCERCGFTNVTALSFHHVDPATKKFGISEACYSNFPMEEILTEAKKCQVLCMNCHFITHVESQLHEVFHDTEVAKPEGVCRTAACAKQDNCIQNAVCPCVETPHRRGRTSRS
jgi:hypothetical protein